MADDCLATVIKVARQVIAAHEAPTKIWEKDMSVSQRERLLDDSQRHLASSVAELKAVVEHAAGEGGAACRKTRKTIPCPECKRKFASEQAVNDHFMAKHGPGSDLPDTVRWSAEDAWDYVDDLGLPDGAAAAMAGELMGVEAHDALIALAETDRTEFDADEDQAFEAWFIDR